MACFVHCGRSESSENCVTVFNFGFHMNSETNWGKVVLKLGEKLGGVIGDEKNGGESWGNVLIFSGRNLGKCVNIFGEKLGEMC